MAPNWTRLIRFVAEEDGQVHLGEVDTNQDVGLALFNKEKVTAKLVTGSIFDGTVTAKRLQVAQVGLQTISGLIAFTKHVFSFSPLSRWKMSPSSVAWVSTTATTPGRPTCPSQMCPCSLSSPGPH